MWHRALCTMRPARCTTLPRHRCITHPHRLFITTAAVTGRTGAIGVIAIATTAIIVATTAIEPGIDHRG